MSKQKALKIRKFGAIDIGSNAVRLLISDIVEPIDKEPIFKKSSLIRVPIRLGKDVFVNQKISKKNTKRLVNAMKAFHILMGIHEVEKYKACATSAMREAKNGNSLVKNIFKKTHIKIDIIGGQTEAAIIASTDIKNYFEENKTYLYVDVGGGSTEFTIIHDGEKMESQSFNIGTVRLLNDLVKEKQWKDLKKWIKQNTEKYHKLSLIGSGGNINKIFKESGVQLGKPLSYIYLSKYYAILKEMSYEERIIKKNFKEDRADVILPAIQIYMSAMKWAEAKDVYVPKIGLSDGIIKSIYYETIEGEKYVKI